jgi:subtilisin family serine protease
MKLSKHFLLYALFAIILTSCNSAVAPILSTNPQNNDKTPIKTTALSDSDLKRWSDLDIVKDTIPGMSVDRAYSEIIKNKKGSKIIVGVIDSGLDIDHQDLKGKIWTNANEIAGNNKDDDGNGYIDDVHGWNFLGEATDEQLEMTRIVKKGNTSDANYAKAKADLDAKLAEANQMKPQIDMILKADDDIKKYLKKTDYSLAELKAITTTDANITKSKAIMLSIAAQAGEGFHEEIKSFQDYVYDQINYNLNVNYSGRKTGDNPDDMTSKFYGNGNVKGPDVEDAMHGTHVSGIIAQIRGNNLGGDGVVADNVYILPVRAVPNGDEYDKDIALAIRYAVDNGAKVINGSFGKDYSPHSDWVWDAIKYAASKDVLLVHAAGNDSKNIDTEPNFPTDEVNGKEIADNMLTIGALNKEMGSKLVAPFSNFGKINVDVFSPGMEIYATVPNNKYKMEQGTSMASPNVAGVAALIRSYYPKLTASQVKHIIMDSGTPININVAVGESKTVVPFSTTCVSGKIVNAYNAMLLAEQMSKK